jgi:DNA primase
MIIPLEFYNYLRQQVKLSDIVRQKVSLTKKSHGYVGLCPFHSEKTPSLNVNDAKRFYYCFGCGASGDVVKFVSETTGLAYKEAAIKIAQDNGIELPKMTPAQKKEYEEADQIYNILELASVYFMNGMTKEVLEYLAKRNINEDAIKKFSIGYTHKKGELIKYFESKSIPLKDLLSSGLVGKHEDGKIYEIFNNRVMFPIRNIYNKIVGFGGRVIGDAMPKYINSPETLVFKKSDTMYGENVATSASYKKNYSIIVEGYMDVIALNLAGINEAVASLGTAVTEKHLQKLWKSGDEIIVCLDGDDAGQRASLRLINLALPFIEPDKKLSFVKLPDKQDPDDIIKKGGVVLFNKLLSNRVDLSKTIWQNEYEGKSFTSAESRASLEKNLEEYCDQIKDKTIAVNFRRYFKDQTWQNFYNNRKKTALGKEKKTFIANNNGKQYTEMEVIELSLCSFMVKFPDILKISATKEYISGLTFSAAELNEFKDWFINQLEEHDDITENEIAELVKNTRFYDSFLVLSDPSKMFLDLGFVNKNRENCELVFDWLSKKHYLLLLKQEYINLMSGDARGVELRASFFLKEIQDTSKELGRLNEFFID